MKSFDADSMLADLDSPEAEVMDGSVIVTASAADFLADLYVTLVTVN